MQLSTILATLALAAATVSAGPLSERQEGRRVTLQYFNDNNCQTPFIEDDVILQEETGCLHANIPASQFTSTKVIQNNLNRTLRVFEGDNCSREGGPDSDQSFDITPGFLGCFFQRFGSAQFQ